MIRMGLWTVRDQSKTLRRVDGCRCGSGRPVERGVATGEFPEATVIDSDVMDELSTGSLSFSFIITVRSLIVAAGMDGGLPEQLGGGGSGSVDWTPGVSAAERGEEEMESLIRAITLV